MEICSPNRRRGVGETRNRKLETRHILAKFTEKRARFRRNEKFGRGEDGGLKYRAWGKYTLYLLVSSGATLCLSSRLCRRISTLPPLTAEFLGRGILGERDGVLRNTSIAIFHITHQMAPGPFIALVSREAATPLQEAALAR